MKYFPDQGRFWSWVEVGPPASCWMWFGNIDNNGVGRVHMGTKRGPGRFVLLAHQVAFELHYGRFAPEIIGKTCCETLCCNPAHMYDRGARSEHTAKLWAEGRLKTGPRPSMKGAGHPQAKLTNDDAVAIRMEYAGGGVTQREIARRYGVVQRTIAKIVNGVSFQNV